MSKELTTFLLSILFVAPTLAATGAAQKRNEPVVALGVPQYSGTGCPLTTISSVLSQNGAALSLLFDNFVVDAGASSPVARKNCNVEIPMQVPSGIRASIIGVDYRGFNNLPAGAKSEFSVEYVFEGGLSRLFNATFHGPLLENYLLQNTLSTANQVWTSCGGATVLRGNKALVVTANAAGEQAMSTVDSMDAITNDASHSGMTFYFQWQACTSNPIANQTSKPSAAASLNPAFIGFTGLVALLACFVVG